MSRIEAVAPGKLLVIGEYAVLDGAPALAMAVDRRVRVRVAPAPRGVGRLSAPQLGIDRAPAHLVGGELRCPDASGGLGVTGRLIPGILRELGRAADEFAALELEIDSGELFESRGTGPVKLGLGSSAAVSAALATGLGAYFDSGGETPDAQALLQRWLPVYRAALGGRASGADLAVALAGGVVEFRVSEAAGRVRPVSWPADLCWRAVWTGEAAQTTDFVAAFEAWKCARPEQAASMHRRLEKIASRAVAPGVDAETIVAAAADYAEALLELGTAMGLEIMSAPHRRLARLARRSGVVYKSCGAGGGDLGIALSLELERLETFARDASDAGAVPLNLQISESGASFRQREGSDMDNN